ncbi:MAG: hypothetical protein L6R37_003808 [Teloschistes peruensis]|nr:MAG: hypothetical protein L6R37_003808 [Teloschistes peruensis]
MANTAKASTPPAEEKPSRADENGQTDAVDAGHISGGASDEIEDPEPNGAVASDEAPATETYDQEVETNDSAPAAAQTPASGKKASNGSSKKKAAVPEHKTKKLNRKASKRMTNLDAQPGQYYLARMKGHPPWPSVVCDEEMLPMSLLETRPVTTKMPGGSYKKPEYADGGKRVYERTFPIMFLATNEFAWMPNTELTRLDPSTIDPDNIKGKAKQPKQLTAAFAIASEQHDLKHFKEMLADHQRAVKEDAEAQAERDTKKAAAKGKRKSVDAGAAPVEDADEMEIDEDDDEEPEPKPKSKKRKKEADSDAEEKPAKTPKTSQKLKLSTPKTPAESSTKKKATKPKTSVKKAAKVSEDETDETPKVEEKRVSAKEAYQAKEKRILYFRHKLQRGFLSRDVPPKEEEMGIMAEYLTELETYGDLEAAIILNTKINKVLKGMIKIPSIPQNEIHQFKERSLKLLSKWNETLAAHDGARGSGDMDDDHKAESAAPTTNGLLRGAAAQAAQADAGEVEAAEEEKEEALEKQIGTTTEGAKEAEAEDDKQPVADKAEEVETENGDEPDVEGAPAKEYEPPSVETAS